MSHGLVSGAKLTRFFSRADVAFRREGESDDPIYQYHNNCDLLLERHSNHPTILTSGLEYAIGECSQLFLVPIVNLQRFIRDKQFAWHDMEEVINVRAIVADYMHINFCY